MPPLHMIFDALLYAVLPAFVLAAIVMAVVAQVGGARQAPAGAALGFSAGVLLGLWLRNVFPLDPPGESAWNHLPWVVLAALYVGRVVRLPEFPVVEGWLLRVVTAFGIAWWIIPEATRTEFVWLAPPLAALIFLNWLILERIADGATTICLTVCFLAAGGVLLHAGIARYLEAATVCASALAGIALVAWWRKADAAGAIPAVAVALPGLLLMGNRLTSVEELHWTTFALPACAPLLLAVTLPLGHWPPMRLYLLRLALVLIPLVAAVGMARLQTGPLNLGGE